MHELEDYQRTALMQMEKDAMYMKQRIHGLLPPSDDKYFIMSCLIQVQDIMRKMWKEPKQMTMEEFLDDTTN